MGWLPLHKDLVRLYRSWCESAKAGQIQALLASDLSMKYVR